jgi:hypothetical protein
MQIIVIAEIMKKSGLLISGAKNINAMHSIVMFEKIPGEIVLAATDAVIKNETKKMNRR